MAVTHEWHEGTSRPTYSVLLFSGFQGIEVSCSIAHDPYLRMSYK